MILVDLYNIQSLLVIWFLLGNLVCLFLSYICQIDYVASLHSCRKTKALYISLCICKACRFQLVSLKYLTYYYISILIDHFKTIHLNNNRVNTQSNSFVISQY